MDTQKYWERQVAENIAERLFKRKLIVLYGPRQVGKTTLCRALLDKFESGDGYYSCDHLDVRTALLSQNPVTMKQFFDFSNKIIVLDEAQLVPDIGRSLKILADSFPEQQFIATGSSSFELANKISEPLTGRKYEFFLFPLSLGEVYGQKTRLREEALAVNMIYGLYPEIVSCGEAVDKQRELKNIASSYLYKDVLAFERLKSPEALDRLLRALAYQIGSEVSYNELAVSVGVDGKTIARYIQLLEQGFIVYRLTPFVKNRRDEIKKLRKIYFYDIGIRNAIINNFNPLENRNDIGQIWENFIITERRKALAIRGEDNNIFYWRLHNKQELDWIELTGGELRPFEFKWQKAKQSNFFPRELPGSPRNHCCQSP
jgi:predicted AAA+ superfamily ATPase